MKNIVFKAFCVWIFTAFAAFAQACINEDDGYILNWTGRTWTGGASGTTSYVVNRITGGNPVTVSMNFSGQTGFFQPGYPAVSSLVTGGLPTGTESLLWVVDFDRTNRTLNFNMNFSVPVYNVEFDIFDIDGIAPSGGSGGFRDNIRVDGRNTVVSNAYTEAVSSTPFHSLPTSTRAPSTVQLFAATPGRTLGLFQEAGVTQNLGNANVLFGVQVNQVRLRYNNDSITSSNPAQQGVAVHNVRFCVPRLANLSADKDVVVHRSDSVGCGNFPGSPQPGLPEAIPGACLQYDISIQNTGPGTARGVDLADVLDSSFIFRGAQFTGFSSGGPGFATNAPSNGTDCGVSSCTVSVVDARLNSGQTGTIRIRVELK